MNNYFESEVTIDIIINDDNGKIIYSDSWIENITKDFYEETKLNSKVKFNKALI